MSILKNAMHKKETLFSIIFKRYRQDLEVRKYRWWCKKYDTFTKKERALLKEKLALLSFYPKISIVLPVFNPKLEFLKAAIGSVAKQEYPLWELCIADDGSTDPEVLKYLSSLTDKDLKNGEIKIVFCHENKGISAATNAALELASGDFVAFLEHDDELSPNALGEIAIAVNQHPSSCYLYSDEDKIDFKGRRSDPFFKPDWNPAFLTSLNYCSHLSVVRRSLLLEVGDLDSDCDGAQDWDLILRITERIAAEQIIHIPKILYHGRISSTSTACSSSTKPALIKASKRALEKHLERTKQNVSSITQLSCSNGWKVNYALPVSEPLVSIIIPTRNRIDLLARCISSIEATTEYSHYEIIIADNDSDERSALEYFQKLRTDPKISIVSCSGPFNYSAINNRAVTFAKGDVLVLLNNDIEVVDPNWLRELIAYAIKPEVGAVGALLRYPNGHIQHAGVVLGIGQSTKGLGVAGHVGKFFPTQNIVAGNRMNVVQNFTAVTGACLAVRKQLYEKVGGLDEVHLKVSFNDVDFCLKLHQAGYRNIWTPFAELIHHESASRGMENTPEKKKRFRGEAKVMRERWSKQLYNDPAYNCNLTLEDEDWGLAWPPRKHI